MACVSWECPLVNLPVTTIFLQCLAGRDSLRDLRHVVFCSGESSDGGANPWRWLLFLCFLQDLLMSLKTAGLADQFHRSADARYCPLSPAPAIL